MKRRHFLVSGAAPLVGTLEPLLRHPAWPETPPWQQPSGIYDRLVSANDRVIPQLLSRQELREGHRGYGGLPDPQGIYTAGAAASFIKTLAASYCAPESSYSASEALIPRMELAALFLRSIQHADGTIDLHTTNFHSPPDTAFVVEPVAAAATVLRTRKSGALGKLRDGLDGFLKAAGGALTVGGIHTPNHRWVVCAALARLYRLYGAERYVARIDDWLGEGIDIDGDGQFTEHSTSIYSATCDNALLTVARLLKRSTLLEPVRRNLATTLYYLHADGEVATEGSRRQDQYARGSMAAYHIPYRYLALEDGNRQFAAEARAIEQSHGENLGGNLIYFLEEPGLRREMPANERLPEDYARFFRHSDLVRVRRGAVSAAILGANPTFFSFHKGAAALRAIRLAAAFFGKGQFLGSRVEEEAGQWVLRQTLTAPYYQPLAAAARRTDGDWSRMDNAHRPQSEIQRLETIVSIRESVGRFEIQISQNGCENVPVAIEFGFPKGGELAGVVPIPGAEDSFVLEKGSGRYTFDGKTIEFGPGHADHRYTQLRGALPKLDGQSVYLTGFTPFTWQLTIA